ncbi:hypothetical protein QR680_002718 [Steinernema hermaphroditum]|uniref:Uncharacterized protein n=1 Tax=Steinernema hermaphroditum TaxID=289476 RepID=A0AA39H3T3_9BILA|nr:hypothetical protein QR680_002718 [Steinernema hermaphroditum]
MDSVPYVFCDNVLASLDLLRSDYAEIAKHLSEPWGSVAAKYSRNVEHFSVWIVEAEGFWWCSLLGGTSEAVRSYPNSLADLLSMDRRFIRIEDISLSEQRAGERNFPCSEEELTRKLLPFLALRMRQSSMVNLSADSTEKTCGQMPMDSSDCNTVIVKDCSRGDEDDARPKFAVLLKTIDRRTGLKKLTVHTDKVTIEAERESTYEEIYHFRVNGRQTTDMDRLEAIGIRVREGNFDFENAYVKVHFDGRRLSTRVSKLFKNRKCGLCTMERDSFDDMFTLADNTKTSEMSRFHKSYIEETKECSVDHHEMNQERYEMDGEDDLWGDNSRSDYEHVSPIEQTAVIERSDEMCFSKKLVKKCPKGSSPKETERKRVQFVCVERSSPVARRLLRQTDRPIEEWRLDVINRFHKSLDIPVLCEA